MKGVSGEKLDVEKKEILVKQLLYFAIKISIFQSKITFLTSNNSISNLLDQSAK